ncbi:myotubularin-related protein 14-like protein [Leptotrombidium deliense]|uniref:Myotubularin-related protein 14-like protein n=1 Tax=Leptotrombidium deliense TaxID=299467 RepID=A0A443SQ62_9ACAR|nr:myotubularin-related protein 14-like protein [Leptotrombidium deliense]
MSIQSVITAEDVRKLLELFSVSCFKPKENDKRANAVQNKCMELFRVDYKQLITLNNENGELSSSYPSKIIIPDKDYAEKGEIENSNDFDGCRLRELALKARIARCRARFPAPVILYDNKYVCRSATLSCGPEIYGRKGLDILFTANSEESKDATDCASTQSLSSLSSLTISDSSQVFSNVRSRDINLLKYLRVGYICDLMVEKKKVKFCLNITSSEKADKESRYSDFEILSLPYPGCEFFRDYRDNDYYAEGLVFDWTQNFVDADLEIPNTELNRQLGINWTEYRKWDIITLTQNYLKLLLFYLKNFNYSLLIHCISGWDRTPLFISLLRLSLWADGKIHENLSPVEITFLTVAYDWYLFGHNLSDRIQKGEEILFFCFYFLKFISNDAFSIDSFKSSDINKTVKTQLNCSEAEEALFLVNNCSAKISGSSSSLDSSTSTSSFKSQDNGPPIYFPCIDESFVSSGSYPSTPPTLTNSEEGTHFLSNSRAVNECEDEEESVNGFRSTSTEDKSNSKTTPVAIPVGSGKVPENNALYRSDSWQLVSDTGSIRESNHSKEFYSSPESIGSVHSSKNVAQHQSDSKCESTKNAPTFSRSEKLQEVRSIFYNAYSAAIGFRFKNGNELSTGSGISTLLDHIAGTVAKKTSAYYS